MRSFFLFGWLLVVFAFVGLMAETAARAVGGATGIILSTRDVWSALWPDSLAATRIGVESLFGPLAWDPVLVGLLWLPIWALFGVPGALFVWLGWPRRGMLSAADRAEEDSVFLYDSLAKQAEDEEFAAYQNDFDPDVEFGEDARPRGDRPDKGGDAER